jgi:4-aminobutyrate--pyruvate transaminase
MSATLVSQAIFDTVAPESDRRGQFGHGFTYAGHPVGAAIALEAIRITREEDLPARAAALGRRLQGGLASLGTHPLVGEVRGVGLLAAVQLVESKEPKRFFANDRAMAKALVATARRHGIVVRGLPFNAIAFSPPLSSTEAEIDQIVDRFSASLDEFWRDYQRNDPAPR